jgi:hypothetical protein
MRWAKASRLELSIFKKSKFYPLKLDVRKSKLVLLVLVLVSWFFGILVPVKTRVSLSEGSGHRKGALKMPNDALG